MGKGGRQRLGGGRYVCVDSVCVLTACDGVLSVCVCVCTRMCVMGLGGSGGNAG